MSWWVKSCAHHEFTIGMLSWWVKSCAHHEFLLLLCFFLAQAKIHCNNSSHNCCNCCVGVTCTRGWCKYKQTYNTSTSKQTASRHTNTWKHKQADSKQTYKHMKAHGWCKCKQAYNTSTSKQTANTWKHQQADSKQTYKTQEDNTRHMNA